MNPLPSAPLIRTKLFPPQVRQGLVRRARLTEYLNNARQYPFTLVSAQAGSGKTTALVEWIRQLKIPAAWFSIDEGDNDLNRFFSYFVTAVQSVVPGAGKSVLEAARSTEAIPGETLTAMLINDLAEVSADGSSVDDRSSVDEPSEDFVLILDDFHLIKSGAIQKAVLHFIEHIPHQMHLVIATRADPNLPLARLRGRNHILELRIDQLRFTREEAETYLNQVMQLALSEDALDILKERTEGWIAGMQMAALSLRGRTDGNAFIRNFSGSNRYILDYLVEEVLSCQPEAVQAFLLQTCILDRMCGALCNAVCSPGTAIPGNENGQEMLEYLERNNLFLIPLDDEDPGSTCAGPAGAGWYRYHHLFADLLRARLLHSGLGEQKAAYHSRAGAWFEANGFLEDAITHTLASQDYLSAARIVEGYAEEAWINGQYTSLLKWIQALPQALVRSRPWLCIWNARAYTQMGELEAVKTWTNAAQLAVDQQKSGMTPAVAGDIAVWEYEIGATRALLAGLQQDYERAVALARPILENPPEQGTRSALLARCNISHGLSSMYYTTGELAKAEQHCHETIRFSKEIGFTLRYVHAANKLAYIYRVKGQLQRAYQHLQDTFAFLQEQVAERYFAAGILSCRLVDLLYEWNQLEAAREVMAEAVGPGQVGEIPYLLVDYYNVQARDALLQQDFPGAQQALKKAAALAQQTYIWQGLAWQTERLQVRLWLQKGELSQAAAWAEWQPLETGDPTETIPFSGEVRALAHARILLAQGAYQDALAILERVERAAGAEGRKGSLVETGVLKALALLWAEETGAAIAAMETSLALAEPEGYIRTFLDEGAPVAAMLAQIIQTGRSPQRRYARALLAAFETEPGAGRPATEKAQYNRHIPGPGAAGPVEALSRREMEVLRCMAEGLSNSQAAQRLVIETSTVKRHINNIFAKLGVENRVQALNKAKELDLL